VLALGIRYLNGVVAAVEPGAREPGRERPEWPPHPARIFMALAAAHFQTGAEPAERRILTWLESLPAPWLRAPGATPRAVVTQYVPVNDKAGDKAKPPTAIIQSVPQIARERQGRAFARAWLEGDTVYCAWPDATLAPPLEQALAALCAKVTRIGHSTSLVQVWVAGPDEAGRLDWMPDDDRATVHLRVPRPGTLAELERRYNGRAVETYAALAVAAEDETDRNAQRTAGRRLKEEFGGEPPRQLRPEIPFFRGYARADARDDKPASVRGSVFSPHVILFTLERQSGPLDVLDLACAPAVAQRWREALLSHGAGSRPRAREVVSGHDPGGAPLAGPHLAFLPLAFVGHRHADGHLLGMALVLPGELGPDDRRSVLEIIGRVGELKLGRLGVWSVQRDTSARPPRNLRPDTWTAHPGGARHWSTVTPVAFDRHPKVKDPRGNLREVAEMISAACAGIGLPRPRDVIATPVSAHLGVPPAHAFPKLARKDGSERRHAHAVLAFEEPVRGPVLIGAGRYRGYGACRPVAETP
jgi:CRISPR-associated protein Csb2